MSFTNAYRRCGPCSTTFGAESQQRADEMYDQHVRESHPEAAAVRDLIVAITQLVVELREAA